MRSRKRDAAWKPFASVLVSPAGLRDVVVILNKKMPALLGEVRQERLVRSCQKSAQRVCSEAIGCGVKGPLPSLSEVLTPMTTFLWGYPTSVLLFSTRPHVCFSISPAHNLQLLCWLLSFPATRMPAPSEPRNGRSVIAPT